MFGAVLAFAAAGCGVRPTGVNVFRDTAIQVSEPSTAPSPSPAGRYPYTLFFVLNARPSPVVRYADHALTDLEIADQLEIGPTAEEYAEGYTSQLTGLPLKLAPTNQHAQEYEVSSKLAELAQLSSLSTPIQLACTLDAYWRSEGPSGYNYSVQFVSLGKIILKWNDCSAFLTSASAFTDTERSAKLAPSPTPGPTTGR